MHQNLHRLFMHLLSDSGGCGPLTGIDPAEQFEGRTAASKCNAARLNAAFLIYLCGSGHPRYDPAQEALEEAEGPAGDLYRLFAEAVPEELDRMLETDDEFRGAVEDACAAIDEGRLDEWNDDARRLIWGVFCPEAADSLGNSAEIEGEVRETRKVRIESLNPDPLADPARQLLLTGNVLLTVPENADDTDDLPLDGRLARQVTEAAREPQKYWYDHPIHVGVAPENNEAVYGLRKLNEALQFEKDRGNMAADQTLAVALSASVTHDGLHKVVRPYLEEELALAEEMRHLDIYVFTEDDTRRLVREVLAPAAEHLLNRGHASALLGRIIGVDGEYGRHYSFLKAISAVWGVLVDADVRGTFKIDLDQVFPQQQLVEETGQSFLEHFCTPLWGAEGVDTGGRPVELGMIAGALVDEQDAPKSLFTPDVTYPEEIPDGEAVVFYSRLPQAVSTRAEMGTRYGPDGPDGRTTCIQRTHVTGGTNGILIDSLRRHRPFTPGFIGRAEDQAYIMSVLFKDHPRDLRYVHKDGLIMRHDKKAFASAAIEAARSGRFVGDLVRILNFSYYARGLPWPVGQIKKPLHPFTASFISRIPVPLVGLRLALRVADLIREGEVNEALQSQAIAADKLAPLVRQLRRDPDYLYGRYLQEREGWDLFYDVLDRLEAALASGERFAVELRDRAQELIEDCHIQTGHGEM